MKPDPVRIVDAQLAGSRSRLSDLERLHPGSELIPEVEAWIIELESKRQNLVDGAAG